ncbi:MAG TPA: DNA-formamidopyrimidine glycosylase family protein [Acidimicrobiales bacterium]|nr:DNA-formamidopyrimidine glycosylase family protein [Acidimicrobiales bacterium]
MPELPEMEALAQRLTSALAGRAVERVELLGFSALKTVTPAPADIEGATLTGVGRRGKYLVFSFDRPVHALVHLSQAGRVDLEPVAKRTKPRGSVVRFVFDDGRALLIREHGTQRKAGWWLLAAGDDGPLATLGPDPFDEAFADLLLHDDSTRHLHTLLRDQHFGSGIGRGYADDILNRARLSPFASLRALDTEQRQRLLDAVRSVLTEALEQEKTRTGGLSEARLGDRFLVHNRAGEPCPNCGEPLLRVSFDSHEVVYCKRCQTNGKTLADRRLSRLLR